MVNQRSRENDYAITHALISLYIFLTCSTSRRSVPFVVQKVLYGSFFQKSILHGLFSFLLADFKSRVIIFNWMILLQTFCGRRRFYSVFIFYNSTTQNYCCSRSHKNNAAYKLCYCNCLIFKWFQTQFKFIHIFASFFTMLQVQFQSKKIDFSFQISPEFD